MVRQTKIENLMDNNLNDFVTFVSIQIFIYFRDNYTPLLRDLEE